MTELVKKTKEICELYGIEPRRSKGQNFLINEKIYEKIVKFADISKNDTIIEVGPGLGFLTARLAKQAKQVIAVELDDLLAGFLEDAINHGQVENVEVVNRNILDVDVDDLFKNSKFKVKNFKIVANLPYNITSVFLRKFLSENKTKPEMMVLMLQKEVAERIVALPGEMSLLALSVQLYADPEIVLEVKAGNFWPMPKVDSAVIRLKKKPGIKEVDEKKFFQLLKFSFSSKRKMLRNNLAAGFHLKPADIDAVVAKTGLSGTARAQELSLDDWMKLYRVFY